MPFSPQLLDHFREPRNAGELAPPALMAEVVNPACGDIMRLSALIEEGRVLRVLYKVRGCTAAIAAGSVLTELLHGRDAAGLRSLHAEMIESALGGLPPESKHAAALCIDAARALSKLMESR